MQANLEQVKVAKKDYDYMPQLLKKLSTRN